MYWPVRIHLKLVTYRNFTTTFIYTTKKEKSNTLILKLKNKVLAAYTTIAAEKIRQLSMKYY